MAVPNDHVLNLGIEFNRPIDLQAAPTSEFLDKLSAAVPTLDRIEQNTEKGTIEVFEQGKLRRAREVEIKSNSVQAAGGAETPPDERLEFLRIVATAAESLGIAKRDLSLVDFRVAFRITHWGNHSDLAAKALCEPSPVYQLATRLGTPLSDISLTIKTSPPDRDDIVLAVGVFPKTSVREIRSGEYDGDDIALVCGLGRTFGFHRVGSFVEMLTELEDIWSNWAAKPVTEILLKALTKQAVRQRPSG